MAPGAGTDVLRGFRDDSFEYGGAKRTVYRKGEGPCVLVMTEIPGITPEVVAFCERLVDRGLSVALPQFIGHPGQPFSVPYAARSMGRACVSREFTMFVTGRTSPIVEWMRALARELHGEHGGPGVGVVGMCLTGGFALAAMTEPSVVAPVASQPSLPLGLTAARRRDLGVSPADLHAIKRRAREGACLMALRFTADPLVPGERFESLRRELGDAAILVEIDSSPGNRHGIPRVAHSVLTKDLVDRPGHPTREALDQVLAFLGERLQPASADTAQ